MIVPMKNEKRLHNRVAAGKQPFRIKFGMRGVLSVTQEKGFEGFTGFVTKKNRP